jgi:hypothetical protein
VSGGDGVVEGIGAVVDRRGGGEAGGLGGERGQRAERRERGLRSVEQVAEEVFQRGGCWWKVRPRSRVGMASGAVPARRTGTKSPRRSRSP